MTSSDPDATTTALVQICQDVLNLVQYKRCPLKLRGKPCFLKKLMSNFRLPFELVHEGEIGIDPSANDAALVKLLVTARLF